MVCLATVRPLVALAFASALVLRAPVAISQGVARGSLRVSVTVVRTCTVSSTAPPVQDSDTSPAPESPLSLSLSCDRRTTAVVGVPPSQPAPDTQARPVGGPFVEATAADSTFSAVPLPLTVQTKVPGGVEAQVTFSRTDKIVNAVVQF
jgi:hypothetical protein